MERPNVFNTQQEYFYNNNLNYKFQEDEIKTGKYHNKSIDNKTPCEILYENKGKKVDYNKLKVF